MSSHRISNQNIYNFFKENEEHIQNKIIDVIVEHEGVRLVDFTKQPYIKNDYRQMYSVSKSFSSIVIGILIDQGLLKLTDLIYPHFSEYLSESIDKNFYKITVKDVLTMSTGITHDLGNEIRLSSNWIKRYLQSSFPKEPGALFVYSSFTTHLLSQIVKSVTGLNLEDYATKNLFNPLGITKFDWEKSPEGLTNGGSGLNTNTDAMVKFGRMLLNNGIYNGKQIISKEYIDLASSKQIIKHGFENSDLNKYYGDGYGFQFHTGFNLVPRADGAYGQIILFDRTKEVLVVVTSIDANFDDLLRIIDNNFINNEIDNDISDESLNSYLSTLSYLELKPETMNIMPNIEVKLNNNDLNIYKVKIENNKMKLIYADGNEILFNQGYGTSPYLKHTNLYNQPHYVQKQLLGNKLITEVRYLQMPNVVTYTIELIKEGLKFTFKPSAGFLISSFEQIIPINI